MLTELGHTKRNEAYRDALTCSKYWGEAAIGRGLMTNAHGFQLAQLAQCDSRIRRGFIHAAEMLGSNHIPGPHIIDDACSAFHSQLDILGALMFDEHESLIEALDAARDHEAMD